MSTNIPFNIVRIIRKFVLTVFRTAKLYCDNHCIVHVHILGEFLHLSILKFFLQRIVLQTIARTKCM